MTRMGDAMKVVLFDWNGTLLDDKAVCTHALAETFRHFGMKPPPADEIFRRYAGDMYETFLSYGIKGTREEVMGGVYRPAYLARLSEASLMWGVENLLKHLTDRGIPVGAITAQAEHLVIPPMKDLKVHQYFFEVRVGVRRKAEAIREMCAAAGADTRKTFYVGDMVPDIRAAKEAGVVSIAFAGGYMPELALKAADPDHVIWDLGGVAVIV